ncbi:MAG: response regulator transcription factor [Bacilli bacterium]|nr:response regulator transcription factor [Bacilli bacterium]
MKKIMIVEDDKVIREELIDLLKGANYQTSFVRDFANSFNEIIDAKADLIILDINIPYTNGEILLKNIRKSLGVPVIMVTSKNTIEDEVLSYSNGADDYITKPYNPTILLLKIQAIFKRYVTSSKVIIYKDLTFDISKGIVKRDMDEVILTKNEIIIFSLLLNNRERIVTKDEIMTDLWNNDEYINENALVVNISRLRAKLASLGYNNIIETRKGIGYRII